jgi:hypothetical protein
MYECAECKGNADFITIEGGWYLCITCIQDGKAGGYGG